MRPFVLLPLVFVLAWNRDVTVLAIDEGAYSLDVPSAIARTENCQLGLAIAFVINRDRNVTIRTVGEGGLVI